MIRAVSGLLPRSAFGLARAVRKLPHSAFVLVIAVLAVCGMAVSRMPPHWLPGRAATDAADWPPAPADQSVAPGPAALRCPGCGVVESIRPLAATADQPAAFEFTVRMRDGSTRTSRTVGRANWRVGDRIILMSGAAEAAQ